MRFPTGFESATLSLNNKYNYNIISIHAGVLRRLKFDIRICFRFSSGLYAMEGHAGCRHYICILNIPLPDAGVPS